MRYQMSQDAVTNLESTISTFRSNVDTSLNQIDGTSAQIQQTTDEIFHKVLDFKNTMTKSEELGLAKENIIRLEQIERERFGPNETVRRTVIGIVRDFDINLVRGRTINELSEQLWIENSRYWLSYVLIALSAWINDYRDLADTAISESLHRDRIKSSLFFTLFNLRFSRINTARRWFTVYLGALDPQNLPIETAVMLQAYLSGAFGNDKKLQDTVSKTIDSWIAILGSDDKSRAEYVDTYRTYIGNLPSRVRFNYPHLQQLCVDLKPAQQTHDRASAYTSLNALVDSLDVPQIEINDDNYKARIDNVLKDLISNYDAEELEVRTQKDYFQLVIDNGGDTEAADKQYQQLLAERKKGTNIGRLFLDWVLFRTNDQIDVHVRKFALSRTKSWLIEAIGQADDTLMRESPTSLPLEYQVQPGVKWSGTLAATGANGAELASDIDTFMSNHRRSIIYFNIPNIVAAVIAILFVAAVLISPFTLIGTAGAIGYIVWHIMSMTKRFGQITQDMKNNVNGCVDEAAMLSQFIKDCEVTKDETIEKLTHEF